MNEHKISIVGCGPGALEYLTPAARAAIEHADVLVGAPRLLDVFPAGRAERIIVKADIQEVLNQIAAHAGHIFGLDGWAARQQQIHNNRWLDWATA